MRKYIFFYLLPIWILLSLLYSCEQKLTLEYPELEPQLVIYGLLQADGRIEIFLSRNYREDFDVARRYEELLINDAEVEVYENGNLLGNMVYADTIFEVIRNTPIITENSISRLLDTTTSVLGKYFLPDITAKPGSTYQIKVFHPDFPTATAQTTIIPQVQLAFPKVELNAVSEVELVELETRISSRSIASFTIQDDPETNNYYNLGGSYITFQDTSVDYVLRRPLNIIGPAIEGLGGSRNNLLSDERWLNDASLNGQEIQAEFIFETPVPILEEDKIEEVSLTVYNANEDMWRYLDSFQKQQQSQEPLFTDIFPSEPVTLFSNVQNGFGIFGCLNRKDFLVKIEN